MSFSLRKGAFFIGLFFILSMIWPMPFSFAKVKPSAPAVTSVKADNVEKKSDNEEQVPVEVSGDQIEYIRTENKIIASGNVLVTYKTVKLTCDKVEVYTDSKKAYAEGHVYIYQQGGPVQGGQVLKGEKVYYDFKNYQGSFPNGRISTDKWFGRGEQIEQVSKDEIRIFNASVTTCPYDRPHYDVKAKRVTVYPGDKIVGHDVFFRILGRPVFWWPYFVIPLDVDEAPFQIVPGYSTDYGFYVLGSKTTSVNKNVKLKGHLDYRYKKGVGGGLDAKYAFEKLGAGTIQTYLTRDKDSPNTNITSGDPFSDRITKNRGRFTAKHRMDIDEYTNVITEWNYFSDEFFLQDFFNREYQREIQPKSFMTFTKNTEKYGFLIDVQKRTNNFFTTTEKLPEVQFTWNRREIMNTNFYYQANHQFINYDQKFAHTDQDINVGRLDTFHELSYPIKLLQWDVIPFVNFRESWFSRNQFAKHDIERHVVGNGVDVSTRFYKIYNFNSNFLGLDINKVRHVFEPSFRYSANRLVSVKPTQLQIFDGVDDVRPKDEFIFGFENRIQTKRFQNSTWNRVDLLSVNTFLTYSYDDFVLGRSTWTTWRQEIVARPYNWLTGQEIWEYDMANNRFSFANTDLILEKEPLRFLLNYRFENQVSSPSLGGSSFVGPSLGGSSFNGLSLLTFDINFQLNPLWAVGGYMRTEFKTDLVEEWEIRATRDLHDWYLDFGYNTRSSDINSSNKTLFFELRLKAFPQFPLKGGNRATFARPRIGHFVGGANEQPSLIDNTSTTAQY